MNALDEVTDYLLAKINKVNIDNPKANAGAVYLRKNFRDDDIERLVDISFQIIQMQFTKSTSETPAGEARLTTVSSAIGNRICFPADDEGIFTKWDKEVRVGDVFVEAFYNTGFVDLYYPKIRDGFHIVSATSKWTDLAEIDMSTIVNNLKGTVHLKPPLISSMMQMQAHEEVSVIKGRTEEDPIDIDAVWVRAINKVQRTGWQINERVLNAMLRDRDDFISYEKIEDNKPKELKRRSKLVEWAFIMKKAELLKGTTFYQFVEADYRGRLYYSEPFLNFQGSDIARGVLQFARGKPMDKHGLFWLAVHTACCYNQSYDIDKIPEWCEADYLSYLQEEGLESISVDKMTLEDRVRWTNENMDWIRQAGIDCTLYHKAEKTTSFLACCIEWHDFNVAEANGTVRRTCLLYTSPSPRDRTKSRMPSSA